MEDPQNSPEIVVIWGGERYRVGFEKQGAGSLEETTLKSFKERLKKITGVPVNGQKLVLSGAVMKDETATLSSFGLHSSSKVLLVGSKPDQRELAQTSTGSPEEHALIARISHSTENTRSALVPQIESFETSVTSFLSSTTRDSKVHQKLTEKHQFLAETLMQSLLSLDSVVCPPEFEIARQKRREAVKFTQGLIERVDNWRDKLAHNYRDNNQAYL